MDNDEIEKATLHHIGEITEYVPNSVFTKTLIKKPTGNISVISFDGGAGIKGEVYPFDTFLLLLEGQAEIVIDKKINKLSAFQGIIVPAHSSYIIKAIERFKMLSVTIKSGYED